MAEETKVAKTVVSVGWENGDKVIRSVPCVIHRASEVFRSDNTSCLIPAWSRVPGYHADPLKSEAMPHSTRPQKPSDLCIVGSFRVGNKQAS